MIAVIPVRDGQLPLGADEAIAEAGGNALVIGSGASAAAGTVVSARGAVRFAEVGSFAPGAWAASLAPVLAGQDVVILPSSPDGRDLAPRLAHVLDRPLLAGAISITPSAAVLVRAGGLLSERHAVTRPAVATLEPGARGTVPGPPPPALVPLALDVASAGDAEVLDVVPPDPATVDLAEATRIVSGGAGLGGPEPFETLRAVAAGLGAAWGASRVAADAGWVPQDRFIGTTGVTITANLYIALGISGAVQHVTGLADPDHIISVNTDASAPMMGMADLAIVADARAVLDELLARV